MLILSYAVLYVAIGIIFCVWFADEIKNDSATINVGVFWPITLFVLVLFLLFYFLPIKISEMMNEYSKDRKPGL